MNDLFIKFLENSPSNFAKIIEIASEWYKIQQKMPDKHAAEHGPETLRVGQSHELTTQGISSEEIDAIYNNFADSIVKEKAMEYVKGFLSGVTFAS